MKQVFVAILVFIGSVAITDLNAQCCATKASCAKSSASVEKDGGTGMAIFAGQTTTVEKTTATSKSCAAACTQGAKSAAAVAGEKNCNPADCDPSKKCVPANCEPANCKVASKGI